MANTLVGFPFVEAAAPVAPSVDVWEVEAERFQATYVARVQADKDDAIVDEWNR
jgi:hypothetical protein